MATMRTTERTQALPCTQQKISARMQGNMIAMWHPNDVILPVLLPHIRFNRDMMFAKDNTPRHAARSTHVILLTSKRRTLQCPAQSMDLNPSKYVWDILKRNVHAQLLQPNRREPTRVTHHMCHYTTVSSQIHYFMVNNVQFVEMKLNTT